MLYLLFDSTGVPILAFEDNEPKYWDTWMNIQLSDSIKLMWRDVLDSPSIRHDYSLCAQQAIE
jgi:hypothetical protein